MIELFGALLALVALLVVLGCGVFVLGMIWVAVTDGATHRARQEREQAERERMVWIAEDPERAKRADAANQHFHMRGYN
jgi:hypothetical protein